VPEPEEVPAHRIFWPAFARRRLRRQSDADHIVTQHGDRSIDGVSTQARSGGLRWVSVTQNALVPVLGFEAGQEGADAELELVVGGAVGQQCGEVRPP
jgi:hypothetical protein